MSETLPVIIQDMIRTMMDQGNNRNYRENMFMRLQEIRDACAAACTSYKNDRDMYFDRQQIRKGAKK